MCVLKGGGGTTTFKNASLSPSRAGTYKRNVRRMIDSLILDTSHIRANRNRQIACKGLMNSGHNRANRSHQTANKGLINSGYKSYESEQKSSDRN